MLGHHDDVVYLLCTPGWFTYQGFHSGDSGPPRLKICNFEVIAP